LDEDGPHCKAVGFFSEEREAVQWADWATQMSNEIFTREFNRRMADRETSSAYSDTLRWLQQRLRISEVAYRTRFHVKTVELNKLVKGEET